MTRIAQPFSNRGGFSVYLQIWSVDESYPLNNYPPTHRAHWLLSNNSNALPVLRPIFAKAKKKNHHMHESRCCLPLDPACSISVLLTLTGAAEQLETSRYSKWYKYQNEMSSVPVTIFSFTIPTIFFTISVKNSAMWRVTSHHGTSIKQVVKTYTYSLRYSTDSNFANIYLALTMCQVYIMILLKEFIV